ncbi:nuclease-related domain-containing protein [Microbacterium memoriense]|uniref:NERD domain-containing protein n=1 Tax=Microbacterium memoriense TaxID=2978350 RepID=A0ABT2PA46_9MICO|nr:nuclease-related domain-containing protein [Microbacterium memoriense]MCT9001042.1 NERD domain-containing protein [Microbacterium memoriense]
MTSELPPQLPLDSPAPASSRFGTVAAASVMAECLRVHADVPPRGALARVFGRSPLSDESRPWYVGALGEIDVARRLDSLGEGWTVLHSVPIGTRGSDIDHVVVGASGVFTINTKFHEDARVWVGSRRLLVNGQAKDHLRNTRFEAARTQKILSAAAGTDVPTAGVIAIVGAKQITIREQPADFAVVDAARLTRWLKKQPPRLDQTQTAELSALVRDATTWTAEPQHEPDIPGFDALHREVVGAKRVRMIWSAGLLVAVMGVTVPMALGFYGRLLGG